MCLLVRLLTLLETGDFCLLHHLKYVELDRKNLIAAGLPDRYHNHRQIELDQGKLKLQEMQCKPWLNRF